MKQEYKQLLLQDRSARIPYNTVLSYGVNDSILGIHWNKIPLSIYILHGIEEEDAWDYVKPYLRSMSSMTEEEEDKWWKFNEESTIVASHLASIDWLNANHFDYRGLIPKGLAIEVTEKNNPYKE